MDRLALEPEASGYSWADTDGYISVRLAGGLPRMRADQLNPAKLIQCTFILDPDEYDYMRAFFRVQTRYGAQFLAALLTEQAEVEDHYCYFEPESWRLTEQRGDAYTVTCSLFVSLVNIPDDEYDSLLVMLYSEYNGDTVEILNLLDHLANIALPAA